MGARERRPNEPNWEVLGRGRQSRAGCLRLSAHRAALLGSAYPLPLPRLPQNFYSLGPPRGV